MFSLDRFYHILHDNLISKLKNGKSFYHYPFGSTDLDSVQVLQSRNIEMTRNDSKQFDIADIYYQRSYVHCFFHDQEPLLDTSGSFRWAEYTRSREGKIHILANSEKSDFKRDIRKSVFEEYRVTLYDWYYFFHGFAALDWYRDFQYFSPESFENFDRVFISYNHLISKYRSYRLHLVSNLISEGLVEHGYVSLPLSDSYGTWQESVQDKDSPLSTRAKIKIHQSLKNITDPLVIDTISPNGNLSADVDIRELTKALWHVVTETIYFLPKLHLTEKIFKPIVAKRPFILVAAPGNLAYLKSYGFKTFDRWIDESYDLETDDFLRIEKITKEISKLCALSAEELKQMHQEMREILEYNFNHFYGEFKQIIVDELLFNFEGVFMQYNNGRYGNHCGHHKRYGLPKQVIAEARERLLL